MMNKIGIVIIIFTFFFFSIEGIKSQSTSNYLKLFPLKAGDPVMFGKDVIINDDSTQSPEFVKLCSATNGWLYAEYSFINGNTPAITSVVMRSVDNGTTWQFLFSNVFSAVYWKIQSTDMVVVGDSADHIKIFLAWVLSDYHYDYHGDIYIARYNGESGDYEDLLMQEHSAAFVALASDYNYPAIGSYPHSLGVLYSKYYSTGDSIDRA